MARKKEKVEATGTWLNTYSDMITLMLCFFVALFDTSDADSAAAAQMMSSMDNIGVGPGTGGTTLSSGKLADLGNTIASLPSMEKGKFFGPSLKKATSLFNPEIKSNKVRVTSDERGVVITLASDAFFKPASAEVNIEDTRDLLVRLAEFLKSESVSGRKFRIEGHTDSSAVDPDGPWASNWELSAARAINTLHYLSDFGVDESRFQVAGFAGTMPIASNDTPEGRAYNRRVDIIVLDSAHL